jgi:hypothetical protein
MDATGSTKARGTVIKVPDATPGIVFANGQQHYFTLERVWKSPVAPAANHAVDVEFDAAGALIAITVVDSSSANKEKFNQVSAVAQEKGKEAAKLAQQGVGAMAARMGTVPLVLAVVVVIAFFFLPAASMAAGGFVASQTYAFWTLLGIDFGSTMGAFQAIAGGSSHGIWSIIGLIALAAPFVAPFLKFPWARYLNAAPIAYVLVSTVIIWKGFSDVAKLAGADVFSFSWGFYLLAVVALALGAGALKK